MWCGIDFGTSNCSLSLLDLREKGSQPVAWDVSVGPYPKLMKNVVLFSPDRKEVYAGDAALYEKERRYKG